MEALLIQSDSDCPSPDAVQAEVRELTTLEQRKSVPTDAKVMVSDRGDSIAIAIVRDGKTTVRVYRDAARDCARRAHFDFGAGRRVVDAARSRLHRARACAEAGTRAAANFGASLRRRRHHRRRLRHAPHVRIELGARGDVGAPIADSARIAIVGGALGVALGAGNLRFTLGTGYVPRTKLDYTGSVAGSAELSRLEVALGLRWVFAHAPFDASIDASLLGTRAEVTGLTSRRPIEDTAFSAGGRIGVHACWSSRSGRARWNGAYASAAACFPFAPALSQLPQGTVGHLPYLWLGGGAGLSLSGPALSRVAARGPALQRDPLTPRYDMFLRLENIGRIAIASTFVLLACSNTSTTDNSGTGGAGSGAGGMTTAGTSSTSGSSSGGAGSSAGGSGGTNAAAGTTSGGAGSSAGGSGGTSAGSSTGGSGGAGGSAGTGGASGNKSKTTFFVTSDTSMTGKLGGLAGADARCQALAKTAGFGDHTFHAYLSTAAVNAKDRIGTGPWMNSKGLMVAASVAALHSAATKGDHTIFIDEKGMPIHGQWDGGPVEHDILTGSQADGTIQAGMTCMDWTSDSANDKAQVGHSDGEGPGMATTGTYTSWNSAHANGGCNNTAPLGGAGRLYCFAIGLKHDQCAHAAARRRTRGRLFGARLR